MASEMGPDREQVKSGLVDAGLSEYQAEAYVALLEQGTAKAVDIAHRTAIPVPRIYDVVNELEQRGYVETLDRDTLHVRAHEPVQVIQDLHQRSERLSTVAGSIEELWEDTPVAEHDVTVTKRAQTVIDRADELIREAEASVDIAVAAEEFRTFEESIASLADSDVVVRLSLCPEADADELLDDEVVRSAITEVRDRRFPSPLVVVVDGETTCFSPVGTMPDPFGVIVKGDILTLVFRWFFQTSLWDVWEPHEGYVANRARYASLEEFICDVYEEWEDGAAIRVRVDGVSTRTGDWVSVTGDIGEITYTGSADADRPPTLSDLAGEAAIVLDTEEGRYEVGSWGARREDMEARRIEIEQRGSGS